MSVDAGAYIRATRLEAGMTLRGLSKRMGLSHAFISMAELGRSRLVPKHWEALKQALPAIDLDRLEALYDVSRARDVVVVTLDGRVFGVFSSTVEAQKALLRHLGAYQTVAFTLCAVDAGGQEGA